MVIIHSVEDGAIVEGITITHSSSFIYINTELLFMEDDLTYAQQLSSQLMDENQALGVFEGYLQFTSVYVDQVDFRLGAAPEPPLPNENRSFEIKGRGQVASAIIGSVLGSVFLGSVGLTILKKKKKLKVK